MDVPGADSGIQGGGLRWSIVEADNSNNKKQWFTFFAEYGTHFIDTLHLGGKMIFTRTISSEEQTKATSDKKDLAAEFALEFSMGSGGMSASKSTSTSSDSASSSSRKETKVIVLGGDVPDDPKSGFGDWAKTVDDKPMPVKYTLRPMTESGSAALSQKEDSFHTMLAEYMSQTKKEAAENIAERNALTAGAPSLTPGKSWNIGQASSKAISYNGYTLKLSQNGRMSIVDNLNNGLWDSLADSWQGRYNKPTAYAGKLTYHANGNLVMYNGNNEAVWRSVTSDNSCDNAQAGKVEFKGGALTIYDNNLQQLWSTGTKGNTDTSAVKAKVEHFGRGEPAVKCKNNCVTMYPEYNKGGTAQSFKPGTYDNIQSAPRSLGVKSFQFTGADTLATSTCIMIFYDEVKVTDASGMLNRIA